MRVFLPTITIIASLALCGCQSTDSPARVANNVLYKQDIAATTTVTYPPKKPQEVVLYNRHKAPNYAYDIIGVASVYNKNLLGKERDKTTIQEMMKQLAASIGGEGVIDLIHQHTMVQASVIIHHKKMG